MQRNAKIDNLPSFVCNDDESVNEITDIIDNSNTMLRYPTSTISPDILTECTRRIFYKVSGKKCENKYILKEKNNQAIAEKWINLLSKSKDIYIDKHIRLTDSKCNICACIDAIIDMSNKLYVIKIKSVSNKIFEGIRNKGAVKKDTVEVIAEIWLAEIKDGILIYENSENQDYLIFHVTQYKPVINSIEKKCKEIIRYQLNGVEPDRLKDTNQDECSICEYRNICLTKKEL